MYLPFQVPDRPLVLELHPIKLVLVVDLHLGHLFLKIRLLLSERINLQLHLMPHSLYLCLHVLNVGCSPMPLLQLLLVFLNLRLHLGYLLVLRGHLGPQLRNGLSKLLLKFFGRVLEVIILAVLLLQLGLHVGDLVLLVVIMLLEALKVNLEASHLLEEPFS